jgi:L-ascorbate metabolism protein UlaG (beta-lactamase superfamily)
VKLTYVYNSCFALTDGDTAFVFDYFYDQTGALKKIIDEAKTLYVFVSHSHGDHFSPKIYDWNASKYIISSDVSGRRGADITSLSKGETYKDDRIFVKAHGSTDEGISFYIEYKNKKIFHAGDLNNWHWNEESTPAEIKGFEDFYYSELEDIAKEVKTLDLAFFPVDPRLGTDYEKGAREFIQKIKVSVFVPMHFGGNFNKLVNFKARAKENGANYIEIKKYGETFDVLL